MSVFRAAAQALSVRSAGLGSRRRRSRRRAVRTREDILCALDGRDATFRSACEIPERHRAAWRDGDLTATEGDHALILKAENFADLSGRHDAKRVIAPAFIDGSACDGERGGDSGRGW